MGYGCIEYEPSSLAVQEIWATGKNDHPSKFSDYRLFWILKITSHFGGPEWYLNQVTHTPQITSNHNKNRTKPSERYGLFSSNNSYNSRDIHLPLPKQRPVTGDP